MCQKTWVRRLTILLGISMLFVVCYTRVCHARWTSLGYPSMKLTKFSVIDDSDIWAVDEQGSAHHWDGEEWSKRAHKYKIKDLSIADDGSAFIVDSQGSILRDISDQINQLEEAIEEEQATLNEYKQEYQAHQTGLKTLKAELEKAPASKKGSLTIKINNTTARMEAAKEYVEEQRATVDELMMEKKSLLGEDEQAPVSRATPTTRATPAPPDTNEAFEEKKSLLDQVTMTLTILKGQLNVLPKAAHPPIKAKIAELEQQKAVLEPEVAALKQTQQEQVAEPDVSVPGGPVLEEDEEELDEELEDEGEGV